MQSNLEKHLTHPLYRQAESYRETIRREQIIKGSEKYVEPFNPSSWTVQQLADHAMQENVDQAHYIYGMKKRMEEQEIYIKELEGKLSLYEPSELVDM
ncbi:hypothetical protein [Bacillus sp. 1P06AnD]|uniref:hypothetical protein n=1 Tax=Bacillus sp. 1P06AnD TaxID=3132208 RepID=UPI0039A25E61